MCIGRENRVLLIFIRMRNTFYYYLIILQYLGEGYMGKRIIA